MKQNVLLTITSLFTILLLTFHLTDDVVRGFDAGGPNMLIGIAILVVWLYGTLVLAGRKSGLIITLVGSLLAIGVPIIHMTGAGVVGGRITGSSGIFFWVWTLIMLEASTAMTAILAVRELWATRRGKID